MTRIVAGVACAALVTMGTWVAPGPVLAQAGAGNLKLALGQGSMIGVSVRDGSTEEAARAGSGGPGGAIVDQVQDGTPASRAGFRAGDLVVEFDGERVRGARHFARLVEETPTNRTVDVAVVRDGARQTLRVTPEAGGTALGRFALRLDDRLAQAPFVAPAAPGPFARGNVVSFGPRLGVSVMVVDSQLAEYFGVGNGVLVTSVDAESPAAKAGLRAGDVITRAGTRTVTAPADVTAAVSAAGAGGRVDLQVTRDRKTLLVQAVLPAQEPPPVSRERFRL